MYSNKKKTKVDGFETIKANIAQQPEWLIIALLATYGISATLWIILVIFDKLEDIIPDPDDFVAPLKNWENVKVLFPMLFPGEGLRQIGKNTKQQ